MRENEELQRKSVFDNVRKIESVSKTKLLEHVVGPDLFKPRLVSAFPNMGIRGGEMVDALMDFVYRDIREYSNVTIFVDGGTPEGAQYKKGVDYRQFVARHLAYSFIVLDLVSEGQSDPENMLVERSFESLFPEITGYNASALVDRMVRPHVLMITNLGRTPIESYTTIRQRQKFGENEDEKQDTHAITRMASVFDRIISIRLNEKKPTIITVDDEFGKVAFNGFFGRRVGDMLRCCYSNDNNYTLSFIESSQCCRVCLITTKIASSKGQTVDVTDLVRTCRSVLGVECPDLPKLVDGVRDAAKKGGQNFEGVMDGIRTKLTRCLQNASGFGKETALALLEEMRTKPEQLVVKEG